MNRILTYGEWTITWDELNKSYKASRSSPLEVDGLILGGIGPAHLTGLARRTVEMLLDSIDDYERNSANAMA